MELRSDEQRLITICREVSYGVVTAEKKAGEIVFVRETRDHKLK